MKNKQILFHFSYAILFLLILIARFNNWAVLNDALTPCITIFLLLFLSIMTKLKGRFHQRLFTGLVFALTGDVLILMESHHPSYFLYGVIAFAISHLFYIGAFYLDFRSAQELDKKGARIAIISAAIACITFYLFLRPHLGSLRLPVMGYVFVIALMAMMAAFRNQRVKVLSFNLILAGVLFFILSDTILAINHFISAFTNADLLIIAAYMLAQYLIVFGGVKRKLINPLSAS